MTVASDQFVLIRLKQLKKVSNASIESLRVVDNLAFFYSL